MAPAPAEPADPASPSALPDSGPTLPEPPTRGGNFFHGLLGLSAGRFSETVRQSIPALAKQKNHGVLMGSAAAESPPSCSTTPEPKDECKGSGSRRPPNREPRHLLSLPPEILLMILRHLGFADIVRLRWTCKQLHAFANPQQLRTLFGPEQLRLQLLSHCKVCLRYDQFRTHLLHSTQMDQGYPLSRRCIDCAIKARDPRIRVGRKVLLGDYASVWVCRWCGFPIVEGAAFGYEQMHRKCYRHYNDVLFVFFILGWIQLTLGIVAAALSWKYYRHSTIVFAPTVTNFILLWICLAFLVFRDHWDRTYHYTLILELIILGLWIPPVYHVAREIANTSAGPIPGSTMATLVMYILNVLFRLLNMLGNVLLLCGFVVTEWKRLTIAPWKRPFHSFATFLIMWTYPQYLEQKSLWDDNS